MRRAKHAGGFALIASGPEKRGSSCNLWDEMLREDAEAAKQDTEPLDRVLGAGETY